MKLKIMGVVAALIATLTVTGCKSTPSAETAQSSARAVGVAVALVMNRTSISDDARMAIIEVANKIDASVPQTNTTFEVAWTPIAKDHIATLVEKGKLDAGQADIIMSLFTAGVKTLDYVVNVKYPQARQYQELVEAITHGFFDGFLTNFKPANVILLSTVSAQETYDREAYSYMSAISK